MPVVPRVDGPSAALGAAPNAYQSTPEALGAGGMAQARLLGQGAQTLDAAGKYFEQQQLLADQVRVDDAINQAKERQIDLTFGKDTGFTYQKGINALERKSGQPLSEEYGQQYQQQLSKIEEGLGTERQKRAFRMQANNLQTSFRGQIAQHEGQEFRSYQLSVSEGTVANRSREIGLYYNDPQKVDEALLSIGAATVQQGRLLGRSAEWIEATTRKATSNGLVVALGAALERNDIAYADGFLKKYSDRMDADDLLRVRGALDKQIDSSVALSTATEVVQAAKARAQPSNLDRFAAITGEVPDDKLIAITMKAESGGRDFGKDGKPLTSPAGAQGRMQVMPGTQADPGFGIRPADLSGDAKQQAEERARVGREYLGAMAKRYQGDAGKMWAAYNAGPGRLDDAIKQHGPDWLEHMPAETQAYVRKNVAAFNGETSTGETTAPAGVPKPPSLSEMLADVDARIGTRNPARLKLARDEVTRQWEQVEKERKQQGETAVAEAQRWVAANGGRVSLMPSSLRQGVLSHAPKEWDNLLQFGQRVSKGDDITVPEWYQKFSDRDFLRTLSDDQYFNLSTRYLNEADRKHFANVRGNLLTGGEAKKPGDLNMSAIKNVLDTRLREIEIDPSPKDDGGGASARIGAIRQHVDRTILQAQAALGRPLTDAEITQHIDRIFTQTDVVKGWGPFSDTPKPLIAMKPGDIAGPVRDQLRADFKSAGIDNPTDAQLLGAYMTAKTAQAKKPKIIPLSAQPNTARRQTGTVNNE